MNLTILAEGADQSGRLLKFLSDIPGEVALAMIIAGLLTLFDLDDIFYVPKAAFGLKWIDACSRAKLFCWWWGFITGNAVLAGVLFLVLKKELWKDANDWLAAAGAGFGYLALVRMKFATIQDVPIGFELFYERAKKYVFKRINRITTRARQAELTSMADKKNLEQLVGDVQLALQTDALLSDADRREVKTWLLGVLKDALLDEREKKIYIGNYLLSGTRLNNS